MNAFFIFLVILLCVCAAIVVTDLAMRWQNAKTLLARDIKVKDALITELTLENRMLHVQLNMALLTVQRKEKRGLYLAKGQAG